MTRRRARSGLLLQAGGVWRRVGQLLADVLNVRQFAFGPVRRGLRTCDSWVSFMFGASWRLMPSGAMTRQVNTISAFVIDNDLGVCHLRIALSETRFPIVLR
jgi:hypothetical protein